MDIVIEKKLEACVKSAKENEQLFSRGILKKILKPLNKSKI